MLMIVYMSGRRLAVLLAVSLLLMACGLILLAV